MVYGFLAKAGPGRLQTCPYKLVDGEGNLQRPWKEPDGLDLPGKGEYRYWRGDY